MKKNVIVIVFLTFIICLSIILTSAQKAEVKISPKVDKKVSEAFVSNNNVEVIVKVKDEKIKSSSLGIEEEDVISRQGDLLIINSSSSDLGILESNGNVVEIEKSFRFRALLQDTIGIVNATKVWPIRVNSKNITGTDETICVLDTGVDFTHPDLIGKNKTCIIDCFNKICVQNCSIGDDNGHGTHVAGIISASGSILGVAKSSNLIGVKVLDSNGDSSDQGTLDIKNAIDWCVANRNLYNISVVSLSLGTLNLFSNYCDSSFSSTLTSVINNATAFNISVIAASGNSGNGVARNTTSISAPACITNATAVSATNKDDSFSSYGHYNFLVDLFAPGTSVTSTYPDGLYALASGTSMSAPHVSASFALIRQYYRLKFGRTYTPSEIESLLRNNGHNITASGLNFTRIDNFKAITSLDNESASVALIIPANNFINTSQTIEFKCNATDLSLRNVSFFLWNSTNSVFNYTTSEVSGEYNQLNINVSNISLGNYKWNCLYYDWNNNFAFAQSNFSLTVGGINVNLISPENGNNTKLNSANLSCRTTSEENYNLKNVTFNLWNSSALIHTENRSISGLNNVSGFNYTFTYEGEYKWNCLGFNNNTNSSFATTNYTITYDITKPNITLISPNDGYSATGTQNINFEFNVSDLRNISKCDLILNNASVSYGESILKNQSNIIPYSVSSGTYTWGINCTDYATNIGNSSTRSFVINAASVSSSSSGGGGGGGASSTSTFAPGSDEVSKGYTKELKRNDKIRFFDSSSSEHTVNLDFVGTDFINLTIRSDPIKLVLGIGQSAKLNLTSKEFYDLFVKLESINDKKANLTIQTINEPIIGPETKNNEINENISETEDTRNKGNNFLIIFGVILIFILIAGVLIWKKFKVGLEKEIIKKVEKDLKRNKK